MNRQALRRLIWDEERIMSWGNGWISNGHWIIKNDDLCDADKIAFGWSQHKPPDIDFIIGDTKKTEPGTLGPGSRIAIYLEDNGQELYSINPVQALVQRRYLDGILDCFYASVFDLHGLEFRVTGPHEKVYIMSGKNIVAAIMPVED